MELNHVGTRTLKTTRLVLRPFCLSDAQAMYDNWANDAEVTKFMMWEPHASVEVTQSILESWLPLYEKTDYYHWIVYRSALLGCLSSTKKLVLGISAIV